MRKKPSFTKDVDVLSDVDDQLDRYKRRKSSRQSSCNSQFPGEYLRCIKEKHNNKVYKNQFNKRRNIQSIDYSWPTEETHKEMTKTTEQLFAYENNVDDSYE